MISSMLIKVMTEEKRRHRRMNGWKSGKSNREWEGRVRTQLLVYSSIADRQAYLY
jgi:hypothetical protein